MRVRTVGLSLVVAFASVLTVAPSPATAAPNNCPPGQPPGRPPGQPGNPGHPPGQPPGRPPQYPLGKCQLGLSSSSTAAGSAVTVFGSGYSAGEPVAIALGGNGMTTATADSAGTFATPMSIPMSTAPGRYEVTATGAEQQLHATLEVTAAATEVQGASQSRTPAPRAPSPSGGSLPFTGVMVFPMLALAAGLVAAGVAMLKAARRRSTAE